jgi:uncharacterized membrane protein YecN with MAPEG domain
MVALFDPTRVCQLATTDFGELHLDLIEHLITGAAMKITLLYAGALAIWFLVLSIRVVLGRVGPGRPSVGDGGDPAMLRRIRGHANFAEYVPLILVLIGFLELSGRPDWMLHALGATLLMGRLLHGYAFSFTKEFVFGRSAGIALTFGSLLAAGTLCLYAGLLGLTR